MNSKALTSLALIILAAGCFPEVGEGKARAKVAASAPATEAPAVVTPDARTVAVDTSRSRVAAVGAKVTRTHDIAFDDWSGTLTLAGTEVEDLQVTINMNSIRADVDKLTGHLKSPDFFDVAQFPTATFDASNIVAKKGSDGATHEVSGALTMHGVTKQVTFPATISSSGDSVSAAADFVVNRKDFGIEYPGMPDDLIKDDVALSIELIARNNDDA